MKMMMILVVVVLSLSAAVSATCYDASREPIPDCVCHPSCDTCGYNSDPIRDDDCITCRDEGTNLQMFPDEETGVCCGSSTHVVVVVIVNGTSEEESVKDDVCGDHFNALSLCIEQEQSCDSSCPPLLAPIETENVLFCEDYQQRWCALSDCCDHDTPCSNHAVAYFDCLATRNDDDTCEFHDCSVPTPSPAQDRTTTTTTTTTTSSSPRVAQSSSSSSLDITTPSIVGIAFGALMLLLCLGSVTIQWIREQCGRKQTAEDVDHRLGTTRTASRDSSTADDDDDDDDTTCTPGFCLQSSSSSPSWWWWRSWCGCSWWFSSCFQVGASLDQHVEDGTDSTHAAAAEEEEEDTESPPPAVVLEEPPFASVALPVLLPIAENATLSSSSSSSENDDPAADDEDAVLAVLRAVRPARPASHHHHHQNHRGMGKMARMSLQL